MQIFEHEKKNMPNEADSTYIRNIITIAALLHDVPDHKYDVDGSLKETCAAFITSTIDARTSDFIMRVIDSISFSKENKMRQQGMSQDFDASKSAAYAEDVIRGYLGAAIVSSDVAMFIRNIVSDADKILALGKVGYDRMREYTLEVHPELANDEIKLTEHMRRHADEKLFRLVSEHFIRTEYARGLAAKEEQILRDLLAKKQ